MSGNQNLSRPTRGAPASTGRLPALRPIRDLTMGGGTTPVSSAQSSTPSSSQQPTPRAKFAPNLAAAGRRQNQTPSVPAESDAGSAKRGRGDGGGRGRGSAGGERGARGGRGRGRGRGGRVEPEIIQSKGIFSEGLADVEQKSRADDPGGGSGPRRGDCEIRGRVNRTNVKEEAMESDEQALKHLLKDDFLASRYSGDRVKPVSLPLQASLDKSDKVDKLDKDDTFPVPMDVDQKPIGTILDTKPAVSRTVPPSLITSSLPPAFQELFTSSDDKSGQGSLFFVQLPNIMADMVVNRQTPLENTSRGLDVVKREIMDEDEHKDTTITNGPIVKSEPMDVSSDNQVGPVPQVDTRPSKTGHTLDAVPPGRVGKLQLLKSGRVRLKLTEADPTEPLIFDATTGTNTAFLQQAVVIKTEREEMDEPGQLYVLGDVQHRLLFTPKIDNLLDNLKKMSH